MLPMVQSPCLSCHLQHSFFPTIFLFCFAVPSSGQAGESLKGCIPIFYDIHSKLSNRVDPSHLEHSGSLLPSLLISPEQVKQGLADGFGVWNTAKRSLGTSPWFPFLHCPSPNTPQPLWRSPYCPYTHLGLRSSRGSG